MVHNENAEWEEFSALLDDVVPDTSDAAQHSQSDASHDSQTHAQAQEKLRADCTDEDDSDLDEVDVDQFATKAEMEAEAGTTAQHHNPTYEAIATGPVVAAAQGDISHGSSSTATTRSAEPQSEAAANRARATERGYLARRRAMRKSASVQTAKAETSTKKKKAASQQAGSRTRSAQHSAAARIPNGATTLPSTPSTASVVHPVPQALPRPQTGTQQSTASAPTSVPTPSASSSSALAIPTTSSSRAATSPATLRPPPPLPVGAAGRDEWWEKDAKFGIKRLKAGYRIALPPARPASAPVVGATSAGLVPQIGARHQSAPVASTSRGKRSREQEDRGDDVAQKRPKVKNAQSRKRVQASAQSPSGGASRPQWIPYPAQQPGDSRQRDHLSASRSTGLPAQSLQTQQIHRIAPPPPTAPPSTPTSRVATQMSGTARNIDVPGRQAAYALAPPQSERPMQPVPVAGPSRRAYEQEQGDSGLQHPHNRAQTYAMPGHGGWNDQAAVPRTFARAAPSTARGAGQNAVPQQPLPATPGAGFSQGAYQQPYNRAGVPHSYDQPTSAQSYMMPVPSGWNDPAAVPRTFTRAQSSTRQTEGQSIYHRVQDGHVAYAARPQQQMGRPVPPMRGGGMAPSAEQLPSVDATGDQPVYNQPYALSPPMPAGWNSNATGELVPAYLTMYAPPNHPPPGWNPQGQAPVYEQQPSAQSFSKGSMSSAYGYGYDF